MQKSDVLRSKQKAKDFSNETALRNQRVLQEHKQMVAAKAQLASAAHAKPHPAGQKLQVDLSKACCFLQIQRHPAQSAGA